MGDDDEVPQGRLRRLGRLASLGPRVGVGLARRAAAALTGEERDPAEEIGEVVTDVLGRLKGGSQKVGQIFAQVADDLPDGARLRLGRLFGEAPAMDAAVVRGVIEAELGAPIETLFATFDDAPLASASLGQVHAATLPDGRRVVVKVQYPGVDTALAADLDLLSGVTGTIGLAGVIDTRSYFRALRDLTLAELDYVGEAERLARVRAAVAPWPDLVVPEPHPAPGSARVLVLERLDGPTLHAWSETSPPADDRARRASQVTRAILGPLFHAGIVNADAHPGNFIVLGDGRLGLLDFGAVTDVPGPRVRGLAALLAALPSGVPDDDAAVRLLEGAGVELRLRPARARVMARRVLDCVLPAFAGPHDFAADPLLSRMTRLKTEHPVDSLGVWLAPDVLSVVRALVGLHHALRRLAVPFDLRAEVAALVALERSRRGA